MNKTAYGAEDEQPFENSEEVERKVDYILEAEESQGKEGFLDSVRGLLSNVGSGAKNRPYEAIIAGGIAYTASHWNEAIEMTGELAAQTSTPEGQAITAAVGGGFASVYLTSRYFENKTDVSDVE
ncbi:MAG: hypothetical protein H8Z69_03290 [Nanohaloarchaea archaeon]|nr:hypothetical protein [Candidatus Nanohaloarchaea archaeon]